MVKEKTSRILKKIAINTFIDIKTGKIKKPKYIDLDIIVHEMLDIANAEHSLSNLLNAKMNILNIFDVNDCLHIDKINYLKLTSYIVSNIDKIEQTTSKIKESTVEHIKSNVMLGALMLIVDSLNDGILISVRLKDINKKFKRRNLND